MSRGAPYAGLGPEQVLDAIEAQGLATDGRLLALNSYENRVYQVGLDDGRFVVAKFYRAERWSDAAILEEHAFAQELAEAEVPAVPPIAVDGRTLLHHAGLRIALFPRRGGRAPELEGADAAAWMGRTLGRLHAVAARRRFAARARLDVATTVGAARRAVLASSLLPPGLPARYERALDEAEDLLHRRWDAVDPAVQRLHGDAHPGNVLWTEQGPTLLDFDDACTGPAVQDLWMLLTGAARQRDALLEGYAQFHALEPGAMALVPVLRLLRQIHYAGWIAARWADPAFPAAFPFAGESRWWESHVDDLVDVEAALDAD